jgi:uncharacterized protein YegL
MPYQAIATALSPALVIYLLDVSKSMNEQFDGSSKISHVNEALNKVIAQMVERSTKGELIAERYHLAMSAYSDTPNDLFGGIMTIREIAKKGRIELPTLNLTDTAAAFAWARDLLKSELPKRNGHNPTHPVPMVCHLTDGYYTGDDPEPIARDILQMTTDDGNVLIENIYIGPNMTQQPIGDPRSWPGIFDVDELSDPYARKLFNMSSPLPEAYADFINIEAGFNLRPNCRMLIPGNDKELIEAAFVISGITPFV